MSFVSNKKREPHAPVRALLCGEGRSHLLVCEGQKSTKCSGALPNVNTLPTAIAMLACSSMSGQNPLYTIRVKSPNGWSCRESSAAAIRSPLQSAVAALSAGKLNAQPISVTSAKDVAQWETAQRSPMGKHNL